MAEVKGKFIALAGMLMADKPEYLEKVNAYLEMCEAKNPKVEMIKPDIFKITWDV